MSKINILEHIYACEGTAYSKLNNYIEQINKNFKTEPELVRDIELGIIEQLDLMLSERVNQTVTSVDVDFLIQKMGTIDMLESSIDIDNTDQTIAPQHFYRDYQNRIISGVCAGIAAYFNISAWLVRFIFIILFFTPMPVVIPYLLLWYCIPPALTRSEQLNMKGIPVTINSIVNCNGYTRNKVIHLTKLLALLIAAGVVVLLSIFIAIFIF